MNRRCAVVTGVLTPVFLASGALAEPTVLYQNTFESQNKPGSEWSANTKFETHENFSRFVGRFSDHSIRLTLDPSRAGRDDIPDGDDGGGQAYLAGLITFDLYIIDSWDGSNEAYGPDYFQVLVNGAIKFSETFNNVGGPQTYRPPDIGPKHLGYHADFKDSIYLGVEVPFTLPLDANTLHIDFRGVGLQGVHDESWGIDNLRVTVEAVPAPGTLGLLGLMGALAARRRR